MRFLDNLNYDFRLKDFTSEHFGVEMVFSWRDYIDLWEIKEKWINIFSKIFWKDNKKFPLD